jgi:hypothetical protein
VVCVASAQKPKASTREATGASKSGTTDTPTRQSFSYFVRCVQYNACLCRTYRKNCIVGTSLVHRMRARCSDHSSHTMYTIDMICGSAWCLLEPGNIDAYGTMRFPNGEVRSWSDGVSGFFYGHLETGRIAATRACPESGLAGHATCVMINQDRPFPVRCLTTS